MKAPTTKTILRAVVTEARKELSLNNPDFRCVCYMLVDGLEALGKDEGGRMKDEG